MPLKFQNYRLFKVYPRGDQMAPLHAIRKPPVVACCSVQEYEISTYIAKLGYTDYAQALPVRFLARRTPTLKIGC